MINPFRTKFIVDFNLKFSGKLSTINVVTGNKSIFRIQKQKKRKKKKIE